MHIPRVSTFARISFLTLNSLTYQRDSIARTSDDCTAKIRVF